MITPLRDTATCVYTAAYGGATNQGKVTYSFDTNTVGEGYGFNSVCLGLTSSGIANIDFIALKQAKPSSAIYAVGDYWKKDGDNWTVSGTGVTIYGLSFSIGNFIDASDATKTARQNDFVALYDAKYGAGHTGAQVLAALQAMYGEEYLSFGVILPGTTGILYKNPNTLMQGSYAATGGVLYQWNTSYASLTPDDGFYYGTCPNDLGTIPTDKGTFEGHAYTLDTGYTYDTIQKIAAALIFEENPMEEKLIFDVYLDGVIGGKGPSIAIRARNNDPDNTMLPMGLIQPHVWIYPYPLAQIVPEAEPVHTGSEDIVIPNETLEPMFNNAYGWDAFKIDDTYVGRSTDLTRSMGMFERVTRYGIDGIPNYLYYMMRFDYVTEDGTTWGDLYRLAIPYEYEGAALVDKLKYDNSAKDPQYDTEVNIIGGQPTDESEDDDDDTQEGEDDQGDDSTIGPYDPDEERFDPTDGESTGFDGNSVLTKTYCCTALNIQNVGGKLWSQSYYDVLKVQNNPIENIVALKWFPFSTTGTDEEIRIGNIDFGVTAPPVSNMKVIPFTSTYKYAPTTKRPGYLSCTPYATIKLHLPYVGTVQLDATEIMNQTLSGKYVIDLITGDCLVLLTLDGFPFMNISGKMGVDVPLTSSNRVQTELASASRVLSATIGAAGHVAGGDIAKLAGDAGGIMSFMGMDYSTQRTATHSPACATYENRSVYVEVYRSLSYVSEGLKQSHGLPTHLYSKLSESMGFVKVDRRTKITIAMTDDENRMLEEIMTRGFYMQ